MGGEPELAPHVEAARRRLGVTENRALMEGERTLQRVSGRMGSGVLGANAANGLRQRGFRGSGWSRSPRQADGISCFHGAGQLEAFLRQTDILGCLLPLTPDTRHILNRKLFAQLHRDSPLGAPVLINAGRGGLQNEVDLLRCLND